MNYRKAIGSQIFRIIISILLFFSFQINFHVNAQDEIIPNWINVAHGPFNLVEPSDVSNPVLTPSDVTDVSANLVADPFIFHEDNAWYMFFEVLTVTDKKDIGLATSSDGLHWNYQKIVLSETKPLSYPLVLKSNGEYYMIPEANNWLQVRIYRANNFPYDWTYLTSIAHGRLFSDPSIFHYNNKWWMFVSKPGHDTLYLYYSNDLLSGWTEHPMSPLIEGDASLARPGGRSFVFDTDRIIRIAQKCDISYGEQVRAFEVDILTEEDYVEHEISQSPLLKKSGVGWNAWAMHQFDPWWTGKEWICAVDGRGVSDWSIGIYIAKPAEDLSYTPVTPCRIVDTRNAVGEIPPGGLRSYVVHGNGDTIGSQGGNPAGCPSPSGEPHAVHLNVTAIPVAGQGHLRMFPFNTPVPTASILNYSKAAGNMSNAASVKTCYLCMKDVNVQSFGDTTHVVIDAMGYYYSTTMLSEAKYNPITGHWYQIYDKMMVWNEAKAFAESRGGYLATITSGAEGQWLYDTFGSALSIDSGRRTFGGNDVANEGQWQWITGETWSYTNWADGEPNNYGGNEDCVAFSVNLRPGHGHYWNDVPTDVEYRSLIEYDSNPN